MRAPVPPVLDPEEPDAEPAGRLDRSVHRGQMLDLKALANRIAKLPLATRRTLPLDEDVQAQLDLLAAADPRSDRRRTLMRTKLLLGGVDLVKLEAALAGDTASAAWDRESDRWRTRIVEGDDLVLQAFMEAWPRADRQAIRTCAREARGEGPAAKRAFSRLLGMVRASARPAGEDG